MTQLIIIGIEPMQYDVVHLVRLYYPNIGGMERIVENIAKTQHRNGLKVLIITSNYKCMRPEDKISGVGVLRLRSTSYRGIIIPRFLKLGKKIETEHLHIHGMDPFVDYVAMFIYCKNKILSPHGSYFHTRNLPFIKKLYWTCISKILFRKIPTFSISKNDQLLMSKLNKQNYLMGCGITERNTLSSGDDLIIFGRISQNKRVHLSLTAANMHWPGRNINLIGENQVSLDVSVYKNVNYLGSVSDDVLALSIKESEVFICMSEYEGLGISLLEALFCGLKCYISKIDSFCNIVDDLPEKLRKRFIHFDGDDELDEWKNQKLTDLEKREMRSYIKKNYSWDSVVDSIRYEH